MADRVLRCAGSRKPQAGRDGEMWMKATGKFLLLGLILMVTVSCNLLALFTRTEPAPDASRPLMTVTIQGGRCIYGGCLLVFNVTSDGTLTYARGDGVTGAAQLEDAELATLTEAIAAADFEALRDTPFTGMCPTAYDGQQVIYIFYTSAGEEVIDSCEHAIERDDLLFHLVDELLNRYNTQFE